MNKTISSLSVSSLAFFICGCAAFYPPVEKKNLEHGGYWLNYDAERRGAVIFPTDDHYRYCAEPAPDVAQSVINKMQASVQSHGGELGSGSAESDVNAIELAGRTNTVLIARESLYRICELTINQNLKNEEITEMFIAVISMISDVAKSESYRSKAAVASRAISKYSSPEQVQQLLEKLK
ncbi:hypothetical protein [Ralstonia pseudosolanacearum]